METVFFLMWAADVVQGLKASVGVGLVFYVVALLISGAISFVEGKPEFWNALVSKWWVVAILVVLAILTPSRDTLYLAAAGKTAQIGATAVAESPLGKKTVDALGAVLDRVVRESNEKK